MLFDEDYFLYDFTKMKREASPIDGHDDFTMETQSSIRLSDTSRRENSKGNTYFVFGFDKLCI